MTKSIWHFVLTLFYCILFASLITFIQFYFNLQYYSNLFTIFCIVFGGAISWYDEFFLDKPINFLKKVFNHG